MSQTIESKAPQYLSFTVAGTDYGIPILSVKEILQHEEPTSVPSAPPAIRGVINVRGQVVPVVDLAVKFGGAPTVASSRTCILVVDAHLGGDRLTVGVLADAVNEVLDLPAAEVEPPPRLGSRARVDFLTGVGKVGRAFVLLLELDRVLSASEAELASSAARAARDAEGCAPAASATVAAEPSSTESIA
jgi:chemotaxis signal transduction protein